MAFINFQDAFGAADALEQLEAEFPRKITYRSQEFPATVGDNTTRKTLEIGGFSVEYALQVACRKKVFGDSNSTVPSPQEKIQFSGKSFRIESVVESSDGAVVTLYCVDDSRGV